ncbi:hypothetical protein ACHAQA_003468 [Verticillium albo-atrum]
MLMEKRVTKYFNGIGTKTNSYDKYNDAITGEGCKELIRDVYQYCCAEVTSPDDELWLYGFSRGAYVVRAVSALFRDMATLNKQSTGQFNQDYRDALEFLNAKQKKQMTNQKGELYNFFLQKTRQGPVIQFLGLFDTVKKAHADANFDLSYSRSIRRVRHALAMNEERTTHQPEIYRTESTPGWEPESLIQAWFVGWHVDIGGGAKHDGLSLYPLQWMLIESQKYNLILEYKPAKWIAERIQVEHPPSLVLPSVHGNLQKRQGKKLKKKGHGEKSTHEVQLNPPDNLISGYQRRPRPVFDAHGLTGYNPKEESHESRGIHDMEQGFESDQYPGIIIHDSEGFEAGDLKRVQAFEMFLKKRGSSAPVRDQLHAVWICNDMDTSRPIETAFELVLGNIAKYAPSLPVVLVGTKKDKFLRQETELTKEEIRALETDNRESIMALIRLTLEPLNTESLRSGMVAAQVVDLDLKIKLAIDETVRLLRTAVTASNMGALLVVVNVISAPTYSRLLCNAIVRSFGLTRTAAGGSTREEEVDNIMSTVVWRNLSSFMARSFFTAIGDVSLLIAAPIFEAPVTARMVVKCACDLIIIMDRAFQVGGKFVTRQQIRQASREYVQPLTKDELRGIHDEISAQAGSAGHSRRQLVHQRVNVLIPVLSTLAVKIYKKEQIQSLHQGIQEIIATYRMQPTGHYTEPDESVASSDTLSVGSGSLGETMEVASEDEEDLKEMAKLHLKGGL